MLKIPTIRFNSINYNPLNTGYFYAPYISMYITPVISKGKPTKLSVIERYSEKQINPEYYKSIRFNQNGQPTDFYL